MTDAISPIVPEYEVFKNNKDAVAFFMSRHPILDQAGNEGPFWFTTHANGIIAGSGTSQTVFPSVERDVLDKAVERGVILLVEFENQEAYRCTPCYLAPDEEPAAAPLQ